MNKAYSAVSKMLVATVGCALVAIGATGAGATDQRYPQPGEPSSIAAFFDRIDPDPERSDAAASAGIVAAAAAEQARPLPASPPMPMVLASDSPADRHAYRNWHKPVYEPVGTGAERAIDRISGAVAAATAEAPTVPAGKPAYRSSFSTDAGAAAAGRSTNERPKHGRRGVKRYWSPLPAAQRAAAARVPVDEQPAVAASPPLEKPQPAEARVASAPAVAVSSAPAPAPEATSAPPAASRRLAAAESRPAPIRVSTTGAGTRVLASNGDGEAIAAPQPLPLAPVRENPEVLEAMVTRGSTTHGRVNIMRVLTGKSLIIDLTTDSKRVSVSDPDVAEVMIISPRQVMVNGLSDGETTIIIWDKRGNYTMYSLVVGDALADQVMLEVTVAEINRTAMERHGVDFREFGGHYGGITQFGKAAPLSGQHPAAAGDPPFPVSLDGGISWAVLDLKNDMAVFFKQLQDENLGRVLAEPKLLARSGKEAAFLSGGEIPIVVTTNDDTSIEFKEFGTKIEFTPTVREDGTIDLTLKSEVSEPDFTSGVELFGFTVPAFVTRRTETEVTLRSGESLIVAGLMKEVKQELESKMLFLGDVPLLGYFFRHTKFTNDILELIVVVRPRLVKPIDAGRRVALPTDRGPLTRAEVRSGREEEKVSRPRPF